MTVDGPGAAWNSTGELVVGAFGIAAMTIINDASLRAAAAGALPASVLGASNGATGSLLVTGTGSQANFTGQLDVGQAGAGTLTVANQATVVTGDDPALDPAQGFDVGELTGGSGEATVTGVATLLINTGRFVVGDKGTGQLSIAAGATVETSPGTDAGLAGAVIAENPGAAGSVIDVTGAGSNWQVTGTIVVGGAGSGALSLFQGSTVTAAALELGATNTGNGVVVLAGAGTTLDVTGSLTLGDQAAGELSIVGGAQMTIGTGGVVGSGKTAPGNLDVEGAGSQLTINTGTLTVGANGPAEFTLGIGATLKARSPTARSVWSVSTATSTRRPTPTTARRMSGSATR